VSAIPPANVAILQTFFEDHFAWLRGRLLRRLGCSFGAEDVASESFVRMAEQHDLSSVIDPRAFLTTLSQRIVYDLWRRRDLERAVIEALALRDGGDRSASPEDIMLMTEALKAVDRILTGLPTQTREAFLLHQLDGLTYDQIGARLGVPASVARRHVAKGLRRCYAAASP
jgi:RNA polymerase sigma factor (sigma-70 family)